MLEKVNAALQYFDALAPFPLEPFWTIPAFGDDPYWAKPVDEPPPPARVLFISGPSRNGNHLIHSMLDNHPELHRAAGEDSFLAAFFNDALNDLDGAVARLRSPENVDYILELSGYGINKWRDLAQLTQGGADQETPVWSGIQRNQAFVTDYQDTLVTVDYAAYESRLKQLAQPIREAPTFMDVFWLYLDAYSRLDPTYETRPPTYVFAASGMRAESAFVFARSDRFLCLTPIRPFESFYFSFAKGRFQSDDVRHDILREAWEHWLHKTVDYLLLKRRYSTRFCLINYDHAVTDPEAIAREICRFAEIDFHTTCLTPTVMGVPTKGNSSFPKSDDYRGRYYVSGMRKRLSREYWPEEYPALWNMVEHLAI